VSSAAVDKAYAAIRSRILSGEYPAGSHLAEEAMASEANVSRTPVREALKRLSAEHLIEFVQDRGAFVAERPAGEDEHYFALRALVEGYAAELAASLAAESQLQQLSTLANEIERLDSSSTDANSERLAALIVAFHRNLALASRSETIIATVNMLLARPYTTRSAKSSATDPSPHEYCAKVVSALRRKDGKLAASILATQFWSLRRAAADALRGAAPRVDAVKRATMLLV
jgi:DNA-binding GntR family transcriptional regulator